MIDPTTDFRTASIDDVIAFLSTYVLVLLRHGSAVTPTPGMVDVTRELTEKGEREAEVACRLREERGIKPDITLSSPAVRAKRTAGWDGKSVVTLEELYCIRGGDESCAEEDAKLFEVLYDKLGNGRNCDYFANGAKDAFRRWTDGPQGALRAIACMLNYANVEPGATVLVGGHGNFFPFVVQRFAEFVGDVATVERMQTYQLQPADMLVIDRGRFTGALEIAR